jgi:hypothetical protein
MSGEQMVKQIRKFLEEPFWPPSLQAMVNYQRLHDDHDGTYEGHLWVMFDQMGDGYLMVDQACKSLRFRTFCGGGQSLRVRNALLMLAEAIRLDNEERPQTHPNPQPDK